ncbi:sodium:proton antiporter [Chromobacterium subtsugae]|uniref:Sodium:proton antiporter n=1 Tax=Chromobacterium subtsugae TaxID=251747 RepID=A0ABS7FB56_9NEIS|nr:MULTISPECIES: sodium:proton antiporter [Chromobacterium]KUM01828.1 sodium:proton antiporter [Chromobacterium subtsugae]KZE84507.1 sodium:proton antiporter [Chromobacterium sp. F49]MBW7566195.1 sodium:proton antiporter [Chromobacterium subtsugae]MBW8287316.1 sodium:proton antiporter [Chromobacterium subtsugae]OBU87467.1 sodium:proton antiporter [Chromobacterium subtsugae]
MNHKLLGMAALSMTPALAQAADMDGAAMGLAWGVPFAGILLSIALFPMLAPGIWHHHFGKITAAWTALFLAPFAVSFGLGHAATLVLHALLTEYIPFIVLLFALYTVSGGILVWGSLHGSPRLNTALLAIGTCLASIMGTTGAAMLLIRPLLKANEGRKRNVHVVVFFIFLVANVGGGLTPLGDPPLFLGFLKGVTFGWTFQHMLAPVATLAALLLAIFYFLDRHLYAKEAQEGTLKPVDASHDKPLKLYGKRNFWLLAGVVGAVLMSGLWQPGIVFELPGAHLELQNLLRDAALLLLALASLWITPKQVRAGNEFNWLPILEVGKLFAGIFITIVPVIAILRAGAHGDLAGLVQMVSAPDGKPLDGMYFWMTGILSSFLDNAPTYLVFFNLASGDAATLMGPLGSTLLAISMGAVFMGANTYIGNAPNFMVKAIAEHRHVKMPGFFGYMLWSGAILMPCFVLMTWLFF